MRRIITATLAVAVLASSACQYWNRGWPHHPCHGHWSCARRCRCRFHIWNSL